jgi:hypothetical protein
VTGWTCPDNLQGISVTDELIDKRGKVRLSAILNYLVRGRGPLATTGCDHGALISTRGTPLFLATHIPSPQRAWFWGMTFPGNSLRQL